MLDCYGRMRLALAWPEKCAFVGGECSHPSEYESPFPVMILPAGEMWPNDCQISLVGRS